jgi:hypothetical protein
MKPMADEVTALGTEVPFQPLRARTGAIGDGLQLRAKKRGP